MKKRIKKKLVKPQFKSVVRYFYNGKPMFADNPRRVGGGDE